MDVTNGRLYCRGWRPDGSTAWVPPGARGTVGPPDEKMRIDGGPWIPAHRIRWNDFPDVTTILTSEDVLRFMEIAKIDV